MKILVDRNLVVFSAENLSHLAGSPELGVAFVKNNVDDFFQAQNECGLDDDFRQKLLIVCKIRYLRRRKMKPPQGGAIMCQEESLDAYFTMS
ncbi:hypothetical protein [Rhizobium sp. Leaf321]|uniref:hypothetical protein n=1 Tax=Rhizobium sp. Leaf321 TaxID=1736335 RepID=UPI0012E3535F|nr:hypothetical protein [Rhizobium sp. Leaf321]